MHVTGSYDYDLPADGTVAYLEFGAFSFDPFEIFLDRGERADSFDGHAVGTLTFDETVLLPAGDTYQLDYQFRIESIAGASGQIGTGDGFIEFTLNAVPEPATLFLLPWAALGLYASRRRRRTRQL